jgi:uncharacterized protein (TIGR03437 family)
MPPAPARQARNADGTWNSGSTPASHGSTVIVYATGLGPGASSVEVDGEEVSVDVSPVAALPGVVAVQFRIPAETPANPAAPLTIRSGRQFSQPGVTLSIR